MGFIKLHFNSFLGKSALGNVVKLYKNSDAKTSQSFFLSQVTYILVLRMHTNICGCNDVGIKSKKRSFIGFHSESTPNKNSLGRLEKFLQQGAGIYGKNRGGGGGNIQRIGGRRFAITSIGKPVYLTHLISSNLDQIRRFTQFGTICIIKNVKNTHGGVLLLVTLKA